MKKTIFDMTPHEYLRDLAERLMSVPATYGTDGGDVDRLLELASELEPKP
jgi:hypothetical protein